MTSDDKAFPPPPVTDDKVHVTATEDLKSILGTGGPPSAGQDGPLLLVEAEE